MPHLPLIAWLMIAAFAAIPVYAWIAFARTPKRIRR